MLELVENSLWEYIDLRTSVNFKLNRDYGCVNHNPSEYICPFSWELDGSASVVDVNVVVSVVYPMYPVYRGLLHVILESVQD